MKKKNRRGSEAEALRNVLSRLYMAPRISFNEQGRKRDGESALFERAQLVLDGLFPFAFLVVVIIDDRVEERDFFFVESSELVLCAACFEVQRPLSLAR